MNVEGFVGSAAVRICTLALFILSGGSWFLRQSGSFPELSLTLKWTAIVSSIVTLFGVIYSFGAVYGLWMKITDSMHRVVIGVLFGSCYLLVVPVFFLVALALDPLRLRRRSQKETYWVQRRNGEFDLRSFQRMG